VTQIFNSVHATKIRALGTEFSYEGGWTGRQIDMLKLVVTFQYSFARSPKHLKKSKLSFKLQSAVFKSRPVIGQRNLNKIAVFFS
jgi:hypothetical protein